MLLTVAKSSNYFMQAHRRDTVFSMETALPSIPAKRCLAIGEGGNLCGIKPHELGYWQQDFKQLRPN
jgi:hypothetical protein